MLLKQEACKFLVTSPLYQWNHLLTDTSIARPLETWTAGRTRIGIDHGIVKLYIRDHDYREDPRIVQQMREILNASDRTNRLRGNKGSPFAHGLIVDHIGRDGVTGNYYLEFKQKVGMSISEHLGDDRSIYSDRLARRLLGLYIQQLSDQAANGWVCQRI